MAAPWETSGLRRTSQAPVPWKSALVALIRITPGGTVTSTHMVTEKRAMIAAASEDDLLLVAWPGQYRQDVFTVDDPQAALAALNAHGSG